MKVLKFGAVWCNGCLVMNPRWQEIEKQLPWLETEYYDYDTDIKEVRKWDVSEMLPMFIFVDKEGKEIMRLFGEKKIEVLLKAIEENKEK